MSDLPNPAPDSPRQFAPWTGEAPATWDAVEWPDWVPAKVREEIARFWSSSSGRGPKTYEQGAACQYNHAPDFGEVVTLVDGGSVATGRYVHAWNNMGRVIDGAGKVHYMSTCSYRHDPAERAALHARMIARVAGEAASARAQLEDREAALAHLTASLAVKEPAHV